MAIPFYVAPDQMVQDKAEYARKGIAKGKSIVAMEYAGGIALIAENPSASLNKIDLPVTRIDEVLEENAEEFVKNYVQRGGE